MINEIPVYLFTGFLESGKTKFIQETLEDPKFNQGEKTLLVICEEGIEEYDPSLFAADGVFIETVEDEKDLTPGLFLRMRRKCGADRVIIEYNGMWQINSLYRALPEEWIVYQQMFFADASTILNYNANMRALVVDKLQTASLVAFNRLDDAKIDFMDLHRLVRGISRGVDIIYEHTDGKIEYDEIEDPLPFDINAPIIEIGDNDYAIWYRDLGDNMKNYDGKTVKFKGVVARNDKFPEDYIFVGRHIMTCCADDIAYSGLVAKGKGIEAFASYDWVTIEAAVKLEKHKAYRSKGPVLYIKSIAKSTEPEQPVATFY